MVGEHETTDVVQGARHCSSRFTTEEVTGSIPSIAHQVSAKIRSSTTGLILHPGMRPSDCFGGIGRSTPPCADRACQPGRVTPRIRYCGTAAGRVAYTTSGAGPALLCDSGWIT